MNGSSHYAIGVGAALGVSYVGTQLNSMPLMACAIAIPIGVMLPDADHKNSKLGRSINMVQKVMLAVVVGGAAVMVLSSVWSSSKSNSLADAAIMGLVDTCGTWIPLMICLIFANSNWADKKFKFFTKHRGIMHTLIPVLGLLFGCYRVQNMWLKNMLLGVAIGYLTHLLADVETDRGCPLLWPIYAGPVKVLGITTGGAMEKVMVVVDIVAIGMVSYYIGGIV